MDGVVEFLLKYRPAAFERGALAYDPVLPIWAVLAVAGVVASLATWSAVRPARALPAGIRGLLGSLRVLTVVLLAWCLCRPVLVVAESLSQRNVVAVLLDDSRSMRIADVDGVSRASIVQQLAGSADSALLRALATRYQVRVYRIDAPGRVPGADSLPFSGTRSRILRAVSRVEDELAGAPLSGVVVLTDGAENARVSDGTDPIREQLATLRARGVPVYAVGIGSDRFTKDVEIASISGPRTALRNATVLLDVVIAHRGFAGATLPLVVEDSGRIVASGSVRLTRDADATSLRLRIPTPTAGGRELVVRVPVQGGELIAENNARRMLLTVRDERERVLYVEGEPRPELKFARRAVDGDDQLQLVTLLRSARDKYLRLGVSDSLELVNGFPVSRAELFGYRAIVLGSIEASFFTGDQLRMLGDFVGERGGGLLLLGGRSAFAEGGYVGTPVSELMPVDMEVTTRSEAERLSTVTAVPTADGLRHPILQIANTDSLVAQRWSTLPPLTTVNVLARAKPAASVLLQGRTDAQGQTRPLLVAQRYGRGRVLALGAQDDWLWQMHADIAVDDSTHERLWRQMLRWLVNDVPDRVDVTLDESAAPGEAVTIRATIRDSGFVRRNGAMVVATVSGPGDVVQDVPLSWAPDRDGEYAGTFVPGADGVHQVRVRAAVTSDVAESPVSYIRIGEAVEEFFDAERRDGLLQQLAAETGGRVYSPVTALDVARDLTYSPSGNTAVQRLDLWDAPLVLLVLLATLVAEWTLRRRRGLA